MSAAHCWGQGLWARAEGQGPILPSISGDPRDIGSVWACFWDPSHGGWEVREDTRLSKPQSPWGTEKCPKALAKAYAYTRATLEMCPKKEGQKEDERSRGEGKGENCPCIEWLPPALAVPSAGDLPVASSCQPSGVCSSVAASEMSSLATPAKAASPPPPPLASLMAAHFLWSISINISCLFTGSLSISTLWNVNFLKARSLSCVYPSL